ncbi:MAG: N-6 DNA methylase [Candidatus Bipolaricaulota bacterium]|nr:N-6 DNA methylase [Candidatus Bipolaricaulota bacterium]
MAKPKKDATNGSADLRATLWAAADALRANMDAAEYKHVVLGLIFLKYISDAFEAKHAELEAQQAQGADPEDPDEYRAVNIFWVPKEARWSLLKANAPQPTIGKTVDDAMEAIEKDNPSLKGVLPKEYARPGLDKERLGQLINLVSDIRFREPSPQGAGSPSPNGRGEGSEGERATDLLGRVYEYFLAQFASAEGKKGGQFYTPSHVVRVLVAMLAPYKGRVYDPCCGSGGMFVQSEKFIEAHAGKIGDISIYGQESNYTTWRLAKMNLALRGIDAQIAHGDTFHNDKHPDLKADYVLANPPFNDSDWRGELLKDDKRWVYGVPPAGNANYAWVQHFVSHLAPNGIAGFVLANGSMSSNQSGEGEIRKSMIEADLVDCMVALPGQLFFSTQIPVCLWFIARDKRGQPSPRSSATPLPMGEGNGCEGRFRDRRGETLFIDARKIGTMADRTHRELTEEDAAKIANTYHLWRGDPHPGPLPEGEGAQYRGGFEFSGLAARARELRQAQTPAEEVMWELLRDRRFLGLKFRRQHQIGEYVVDFYSDEHRLVVELDGPVHDAPKQSKKDGTRDAYLRSLGLAVLRFPNESFLTDPEAILNEIGRSLASPLGRGGREGVASAPSDDDEILPSPSGRGGGEDASEVLRSASPVGRGEGEGDIYEDVLGFCKSATLDEIRKHGHVLTPGRYVGAEEAEDDGEPFDEKMKRLTATLREWQAEAAKLDETIAENLRELGYGG